MTQMDEQKTAIHEAGHAVAWQRLFPGMVVNRVTIVPDIEDGSAGHHLAAELTFPWSPTVTPDQREAFRRYAVYRCAGFAAVLVSGYPEERAAEGCDSDFEDVAGLEERKAEAVTLLREPRNIAAVARVARELIERRTLDGDVVDVLIDVADGETSEADFQRYLLMRPPGGE